MLIMMLVLLCQRRAHALRSRSPGRGWRAGVLRGLKVQNLLLPARGGLLLGGRGGAVQHARPVGGAPPCVSLSRKPSRLLQVNWAPA